VTAASRERFAALVREPDVDVAEACLLIGCEVEPDLDLEESLRTLDVLAYSAMALPTFESPAKLLQVALGTKAGFAGSAEDYEDLRSSLLHEVLRRGRGLPIVLSVVWCEVARRVGVEASPLNVPGHVLVDVSGQVVDPFSGGVAVDREPGPVLQPLDLLMRVLTNVRALTERQVRSLETARTRLWATELSLLLPSHPVGLRRERGELLVRLGDHVGGAVALEEFAAIVEDAAPDQAESARRSARQSRARLN
jgi:hypothetical protein